MIRLKPISVPTVVQHLLLLTKPRNHIRSHCDTSSGVEAMKALSDTPSSTDQDNARWNTSDAGSNWSSSEQQGMRSYHCPTCGAELVTDETTAASTCAYCGSPVVLSDHLRC